MLILFSILADTIFQDNKLLLDLFITIYESQEYLSFYLLEIDYKNHLYYKISVGDAYAIKRKNGNFSFF